MQNWATSPFELETLAAEFADSPESILTGSPTAAHRLAIIADGEPCTTREWLFSSTRALGDFCRRFRQQQTRHTIATELKLRCAPCHVARHQRQHGK